MAKWLFLLLFVLAALFLMSLAAPTTAAPCFEHGGTGNCHTRTPACLECSNPTPVATCNTLGECVTVLPPTPKCRGPHYPADCHTTLAPGKKIR